MGSENLITRSDPSSISTIATSDHLHFYYLAYAQTFSTDQCFPGQFIAAAQEKQFHAPACLFASINPRRDDARLVQHQQIPQARR